MEDLKSMARSAKMRLKTNFWQNCKSDFDANAMQAREMGISEVKVRASMKDKVQAAIRGEKEDEFYLKVKKMLDEEGEVSDAIGRLTDKEYFSTLTYEERQRYTLDLSNRYLAALAKYRREKQYKI